MESNISNLPKDLLFLLALDMNLPDILRFCSSSSRINKTVCNNPTFWQQKLQRD